MIKKYLNYLHEVYHDINIKFKDEIIPITLVGFDDENLAKKNVKKLENEYDIIYQKILKIVPKNIKIISLYSIGVFPWGSYSLTYIIKKLSKQSMLHISLSKNFTITDIKGV